jgi:hypothetical protein
MPFTLARGQKRFWNHWPVRISNTSPTALDSDGGRDNYDKP